MKRTNATRETLTQFTERAFRASFDGTLIPPQVYIPVNLRKRVARITEKVTLNPKTDAEVEQDIALADPTGFLVAVMQGQPIPAFEVRKDDKGGIEIILVMQTPSLELRTEAALKLAAIRTRTKLKPDSVERKQYERMIEEAADGVE